MSTETNLAAPVRCEFNCPRVAEFDFKMSSRSGGAWANGCREHYEAHRAYADLGTGKAQRLVVVRP